MYIIITKRSTGAYCADFSEVKDLQINGDMAKFYTPIYSHIVDLNVYSLTISSDYKVDSDSDE